MLTHPEKSVYQNADEWRKQFEVASVIVQWDPERSIRGTTLDYDSIQVGLSRRIIQRFVDEWITDIQDLTPLARKIHGLVKNGDTDNAKEFLPSERVYAVSIEVAKRLGMR